VSAKLGVGLLLSLILLASPAATAQTLDREAAAEFVEMLNAEVKNALDDELDLDSVNVEFDRIYTEFRKRGDMAGRTTRDIVDLYALDVRRLIQDESVLEDLDSGFVWAREQFETRQAEAKAPSPPPPPAPPVTPPPAPVAPPPPPAPVQERIKGPEVAEVSFGDGVVQGLFTQTGDKSWSRLNPDRSVVSGFTETGRDEWSVYLRESSSNTTVQIDLWTKKVTLNSGGSSSVLGQVLDASRVAGQTVTAATVTAPPPATPPATVTAPPPATPPPPPAVTVNDASSISDYIAKLRYDPRLLLSVQEAGSREAVPVGGTKNRRKTGNAVVICEKKPRKLDKTMDKLSILKPTAGVVYPGALIVADRKLAEGLPTPITLPRAPITLRVELPGLSRNPTIDSPTNSSVQSAIVGVLEEWNTVPASQGYVNSDRSIYRYEKAYSSEQLALDLGFRLDWGDNNVRAATSVNSSSESEVTVAFFQQLFYTITLDPPQRPAEVFASSVSLRDVQNVVGASADGTSAGPPAYVRSVDYGRTLMVRMETQKRALSVDLEAALKYSTSPGTTINADLKAKYDSILSNSTFTVYGVGGSAGGTAKIINGTDLTGLRQVINEGSVYSRGNPGVPIAYTVAFLKDNSTASVSSSSDYVETECIEYPNAFIKLAHQGAYVGRFNVTWQEPNDQGVLVPGPGYSSGEKTSGFVQNVDLPGDAVNINIKGEAATGLVWDPWGEAINIVLPSPTNCTYTIHGTTLGRQNSVDCP
jgi:thiol-activated cytolysin